MSWASNFQRIALENPAGQLQHRRRALLAAGHMHDAQNPEVLVRPFNRHRNAFADARQFLERQLVHIPGIVNGNTASHSHLISPVFSPEG
ncbi:hypothetical protein MPL1032_270109 [Mesorhizobium plurifarium]|uniref:Uncharacterized protein n=1 Tax=Mesorhizobium plurifarium TaxID=69974 RepID=A0A0K2W2Q5_MESPL|nr:hypothetical protein MPL1032_270109 [Mesorhizobium plurifarium]